MRNDLVVIVPIHEYNKEIKELLDKAIDSVPSDIEIRFSCKQSLGTLLNNDYEKLINPEKQNKIAQAIADSIQEYFYSMR